MHSEVGGIVSEDKDRMTSCQGYASYQTAPRILKDWMICSGGSRRPQREMVRETEESSKGVSGAEGKEMQNAEKVQIDCSWRGLRLVDKGDKLEREAN